MASPKQVSWQASVPEREELEVDVLVVGAGPAGLACAIELKRQLQQKASGDKSNL
mgnify:FL=1